MVFSSLTFLLLFLPITAGLSFLRPGIRWRNGVLLAASLVFYAWGEPLWVFALVGETLLVWLCSLGTARSESCALRSLCAFLGVALPLAVLLYVKYAGFLLAPALSPFGIRLPETRMPLGVSFFTFQIITYAVDTVRDPDSFQPDPLRLLLYVACFPQLIAGPIVRYGEVREALDWRETLPEDFTAGMQRFACGLGKKVLLANVCGKIVDAVVRNQADYGASVLGGWYFALLYALQIYFDFSGYSDMAIGLGRVFGFRYSENFRYPYLSAGISEFWRRWHISLGSFFREYVYIPLGGSRCSVPRQLFNLLLVWALTGLWHGAAANFVLWGLYFFLLIVLERFVLRKLLPHIPAVIRILATFLLVLAGWVIFYFTDFTEMVAYLSSLVGVSASGRLPLATPELLWVIRRYSFFPAIALLAAFPFWRRLESRLRPLAPLWLTAVFVLSILFIVGESYNPFIYFRF